MKRVLFSLFFVVSLGYSAPPIVESLGDIKLNKTSGKVYLSGRYQANGRFKSDANFLSGGRIYFTLGKEDYSYTLRDVLGHPDLLRKKNDTQIRGIASSDKSPQWQVIQLPYLDGKKISFIPKDKNTPIKKVNVVVDAESSMKSLFLDFGAYNLSFFAS
jgi:hypothetical protein